MKYKAVLFDMDGTVLNTLDDLTDSMNHALTQFGFPEITTAHAASVLGNGAGYFLDNSIPEGTPRELRDQILAEYAPWYDAHCQIKTAPYPGIAALMEKLRQAGIKLAVISNKQDSAVKPLAAQHFPGLLDFAVGESATVRRKPDPDAVLTALKALGVRREESIYIGDTEVDLQTAENAGTDCAAVTWGFRTAQQLKTLGAKHIFDSAEELGAFLLED